MRVVELLNCVQNIAECALAKSTRTRLLLSWLQDWEDFFLLLFSKHSNEQEKIEYTNNVVYNIWGIKNKYNDTVIPV